MRSTTNPDAEAQPQPAASSWQVSLRLLRTCLPGERRRVAIGMLLLLLATAVQLLQPWPIKVILDVIVDPGSAPAWLMDLARSVASEGDASEALMFLLCASMLAIHLAAGLLTVGSTYFILAAGLRMVFKLRCRLFDHVQRLSLRFHDSTTVGDSLYRVTWDTYAVQTVFNNGMVPVVSSACMVGGITFVMWQRDPVITLAALAVMVPLTLLVRRLERPMSDRSMRVQERESGISTLVQQTLTSIRVVQAYVREDAESDRFRDGARQSLNATLKLNVLQTAAGAAVSLLLASGTAVVVWLAASGVTSGRLTPGDVMLLIAYVGMLYKPLDSGARTAAALQQAAARARRVLSLLDRAPDVRDLPTARPLRDRARGHIAFDDVRFAYDNGRDVLRGVRFEIQPGTTTALVGASGAGKTTIASLLLRFYDPTGGGVRLDGVDLRAITLASLRRNVAFVPQEPVLFASSIAQNIAYGRPDATAHQIAAAARAAGAEEFVNALPDGFETVLGERGLSLSGGQRQRIAIARAFLQDAPVLVMDEPTSALDTQTEAHVLAALTKLKRGRTTLIIAHRLSTVRDADQIVVLNAGRVQEVGRHQDLVREGGAYAGLCAAQFGLHATDEATGRVSVARVAGNV